jgi:SAM-dependent methyltransferase
MKNLLSKIYRAVYPEKKYDDFPTGFIGHSYIKNNIKGEKVLIIGDYMGWGYEYVKSQGFDVKVLDIVDNDIVAKEDLIIQSIESPTSFADNHFDSIILFEVIEHLWQDVKALKEIHRILADNGVLLLSAPFFHDKPEYHFRIHSKASIFRLLKYTGFKVLNFQLRGIMCSKYANYFAGMLAILIYPFVKERGKLIANKISLKIHNFFSNNNFINSKFGLFGIYITLCKGEITDSIIQNKEFSLK